MTQCRIFSSNEIHQGVTETDSDSDGLSLFVVQNQHLVIVTEAGQGLKRGRTNNCLKVHFI